MARAGAHRKQRWPGGCRSRITAPRQAQPAAGWAAGLPATRVTLCRPWCAGC